MTTVVHSRDAAAVRCGDQMYSSNFGGMLTVIRLSFGKVPVQDVLDGIAAPTETWLTADGLGALQDWHEGEEHAAVYFEMHDAVAVRLHGFVDAVSRQIVQLG